MEKGRNRLIVGFGKLISTVRRMMSMIGSQRFRYSSTFLGKRKSQIRLFTMSDESGEAKSEQQSSVR